MAYEPQTKRSLLRFALRRSYWTAAAVTAVFAVVALVRALTTAHRSVSVMWAIACLAGFYLFALLLSVLRWLNYVDDTRRAARKKGFDE